MCLPTLPGTGMGNDFWGILASFPWDRAHHAFTKWAPNGQTLLVLEVVIRGLLCSLHRDWASWLQRLWRTCKSLHLPSQVCPSLGCYGISPLWILMCLKNHLHCIPVLGIEKEGPNHLATHHQMLTRSPLIPMSPLKPGKPSSPWITEGEKQMNAKLRSLQNQQE